MRNKLKSTSRIWRSIVIGLIVCLACVELVELVDWTFDISGSHRRGYAEGHKRARTFSGLYFMAANTMFAVSESREQPPKDMNELVKFINRQFPGLLEDPGVQEWLDPNTGSLVDAWNNPVKLVVESRNLYVFISPGPNGKDEDGQGDDITYSFNPWEDLERRTDQKPVLTLP